MRLHSSDALLVSIKLVPRVVQCFYGLRTSLKFTSSATACSRVWFDMVLTCESVAGVVNQVGTQRYLMQIMHYRDQTALPSYLRCAMREVRLRSCLPTGLAEPGSRTEQRKDFTSS